MISVDVSFDMFLYLGLINIRGRGRRCPACPSFSVIVHKGNTEEAIFRMLMYVYNIVYIVLSCSNWFSCDLCRLADLCNI